MQKGLAFLFLILATGLSPAQDALPPWSADAQKTWWAQNPTPDLWPKAADTLQAQLEGTYKQHGVSCLSNPDFQGWLDHLEWIRLGVDNPKSVTDPTAIKTFVALAEDETISHLFVEKMKTENVRAAAFQNLMELGQANLDDLHEYAALGVAFSLVFDKPFPPYWPHPQVKQSAVPIGDLDVLTRFNFYVRANRNKKTELDLTQLSFDDLKFLVDSEVKLPELEYAQVSKIPYDHFADAFFSIHYDDSRIQSENEVFTWPLPTYTLNDIETNGGICVDQAYYAFLLGKGRGIPTIYFHGLGTDGGHAWFGYLTKSGKWDLNCGRYASQNYPKGYAVDPQTWLPITDATLQDLAKNGGTNPNFQAAETGLAWARLHAGTPVYRQILEDARSVMPELAETWQTEADFVDGSSEIDPAEKKAFYQSWIAQFETYPDMKVEGEQRLVALLKKTNDPDVDAIQRDIILQNRSSGFDLGIEGSFGAISDKIDAQDWDGARLDYEKAVRDFNEQGGSTFFYGVIQPYVSACLRHGQIKQAEDGLKFTEERMSFNDGSIVSNQFDDLKDWVKTSKTVTELMGKWLGEIDDGNYEQTWNESSKAFQERVALDKWTDEVNKLRQPFGKFVSRQLVSAMMYHKKTTSASGQTLVVATVVGEYDSVFDSKPHVDEKVAFQKNTEGVWQAFGYAAQVHPDEQPPAAGSGQ